MSLAETYGSRVESRYGRLETRARRMAAGGNKTGARGAAKTRIVSRQPIDVAARQRVCSLIRSWPEGTPLTWESLVAMLAQGSKGAWSRQALSRHPEIVEALHRRKDDLRKGKPKVSRDPAIVVLGRQVAEKDAEIVELRNRLARYEERFLTMIRNAAVRGLTQADLERPLPTIDRKRV